jgi:hypothetical protein
MKANKKERQRKGKAPGKEVETKLVLWQPQALGFT